MTPIALRKKLLIAESELNRAHLLNDLETLTDEVRVLAERAQAVGSITTSAIGLVTGLVKWQRGGPTKPPPASSWIETALHGTGMLTKLWRLWTSKDGSR